MNHFTLSRNAFGKLVFSDAGGVHEGVVPVRAFPIAAPDTGIAIVDVDGHELTWINRLEDLPADTRAMLQEELKSREFLPVISRIRGVSTFAVPSTWEVETDRGLTSFVLKGEEDIRRIAGSALIIADSHGVQYLIRDQGALDKGSRKLLDRFL
ncbi:MAG TPA: DUF1854 domain-containing protein [Noviherbaspirillum sp.]|nr:DUF1854 domain-containing protein [Noviherbaspirillum sp.]